MRQRFTQARKKIPDLGILVTQQPKVISNICAEDSMSKLHSVTKFIGVQIRIIKFFT